MFVWVLLCLVILCLLGLLGLASSGFDVLV